MFSAYPYFELRQPTAQPSAPHIAQLTVGFATQLARMLFSSRNSSLLLFIFFLLQHRRDIVAKAEAFSKVNDPDMEAFATYSQMLEAYADLEQRVLAISAK